MENVMKRAQVLCRTLRLELRAGFTALHLLLYPPTIFSPRIAIPKAEPWRG
jgi:hypothetical protein